MTFHEWVDAQCAKTGESRTSVLRTLADTLDRRNTPISFTTLSSLDRGAKLRHVGRAQALIEVVTHLELTDVLG